MKYFKIITFAMVVLFATTTRAQVHVNVSIGTPPAWAPPGNPAVRYYYLPEVESYYDVQTSRFIYLGGGTWVQRATLPPRYRSYDLYKGQKVVLTDYRGNRPYAYFKQHKVKYGHAPKVVYVNKPYKYKDNGKKFKGPKGHGGGKGGKHK